jgi:hypothetical protein
MTWSLSASTDMSQILPPLLETMANSPQLGRQSAEQGGAQRPALHVHGRIDPAPAVRKLAVKERHASRFPPAAGKRISRKFGRQRVYAPTNDARNRCPGDWGFLRRGSCIRLLGPPLWRLLLR